jgi:hypothetical protein
MSQIREDDHAVTIVRACALRHLAQRQLHLPLIHPEDDLMAIDGLPYLRPPVLVELMRIVIEEYLVGIKRVLSLLPITDGRRILLRVVRPSKN